jgi:CRP/FNR family transcriptional regulator
VGVPVGASAAGTPRRLPHGDVVVRQGDRTSCLFLVIAGVVRLSCVTREGREVVVALLGAGDLFGEDALLDQPSAVDARAVGRTEVVVLPLVHVRDVLRHSPATAEEMLRLVASRLHRTSRSLQDALAGTLPVRLSGRLRDLAEVHGATGPDGVHISVPITQDELARMVGASREAVNRTLGGMTARGLVRLERRTVVIPDPAALGPDAHEGTHAGRTRPVRESAP